MDKTSNRIYRETSTTYDGGPAFPTSEMFVDSLPIEAQPGMSLRDYFAIKALVGLMTMPDEWRGFVRNDGAGTTWKAELSKAAYDLADAMLHARESS
ncbi:gp38 [Burkholderia pseudomallei]|uniref:hypothetical protein n=1 Tax=Burkholderia pseudomallei TaxID=28450 RepID=UPI0003A44D1D|nr:hypothetical protein [Burkholderia pseudomallei]MCE2035843.1 hypothetical protein [Burkholderia pseudomallei CS]MCE2041851.1 hypothetical protein [Burkholderia pseudomallei CB]MCQ8219718.1 hypothetical protein [Burkholderia pseudomallei]MCW0102546.1 hypothetical protein [Burkholderia pseudomallei]MCW0132744.1 hypothetical protein [Burkholderia pseudomallei]